MREEIDKAWIEPNMILTLVMKDKLELSNFELLWLESYLSRK